MNSNIFITGILPELNYRFVIASAGDVTAAIARQQGAGLPVARIMGESMVGSFFLSTHTTKQDIATVSLHLECKEPLTRIISFASSNGGVRCHTVNPEVTLTEPVENILEGGILRVNRWLEKSKKVYSSATSLRKASLQKNLEEYVGRSEQIQSFLYLKTSGESLEDLQVFGYFFQALPEATFPNTEAMVHLLNSGKSLSFLEQFLSAGEGEHSTSEDHLTGTKTRILSTGQFHHTCDCSLQRVEEMVVSMGEEEARQLVETHGQIETTCEFCKRKYVLSSQDLDRLFHGGDPP